MAGRRATYLLESLEVFNAQGVDSVFVNTFARYDLPHHSDPSSDLDLACYGVVRVLAHRFGNAYPELRWEPKVAFTALADWYAAHGT